MKTASLYHRSAETYPSEFESGTDTTIKKNKLKLTQFIKLTLLYIISHNEFLFVFQCLKKCCLEKMINCN